MRKPKLTPHQSQEILRRREYGEAVREIVRSYNVHNTDALAMTIKETRTTDATNAFEIIEQLTFRDHKELIFRGHLKGSWKLQSTLSRHIVGKRDPLPDWIYDDMLSHFFTRLTSIGIEPAFNSIDMHARLEFGRHYGVPSPVIDFSYSPFVAMFFAFNGVRPDEATDADYSVLYCVNRGQLGLVWAREYARRLSASASIDPAVLDREYRKFMVDDRAMFEKGYPKDDLRFMRFPASWNRRMQRQMGCFLYDTVNYESRKYRDLEHYMEQAEIPSSPPSDEPMLRKILIPHKAGQEIFSRLDLMGISGTHLYDSHEGAAMDVINSYNYGRKTGFAWDTGAVA